MALGGRGGSGGAAPGAAAMAAVGEERREPERDGGCEHYRRGCLLRVRRRRRREREPGCPAGLCLSERGPSCRPAQVAVRR